MQFLFLNVLAVFITLTQIPKNNIIQCEIIRITLLTRILFIPDPIIVASHLGEIKIKSGNTSK